MSQEPRTGVRVPIVGIGASAGGFEAFTQFLKNLPVDTGMAFVLVQHLDPDHTSALTHLLSKATSLPMREITNDLPVEPNQVYVIPPNKNLGIVRGVLKLRPRPTDRGAFRSIDSFFESLAQDQREFAVGVILSGTASDGTMGLEAIKAEGGITFAQDETAKHDSMPRSAIAAGCVDFVFPPEKIAQELARIARHPLVDRRAHSAGPADISPRPAEGTGVGSDRGGFERIVLLLRKHTGVDFSLYKTNTLQRRIQRRMVLNKLTTHDAYAQLVRGEPRELDALYSDVLISVTSFFRNPEAFGFLQRKVFPKILSEAKDEPLRVWVLGCSTGQEAYSVAMAFTEFFDRIPHAPKLQIFASDLNEAVLVKARAGLYAKSVVQDVSPERLRRFFVEEDGGYRVIKPLREAIVFARQNILSDPPFSRVAMISCRNLLIYIEPSLQKKIISTFHYALKPNGCLFLGASESIGTFTDLFEPADKKHRIYFRRPGPSPERHLQHAPKEADVDNPSAISKPSGAPEEARVELNAQREADRVTRNRYAPPGVLVDADLHILEFRGDTSRYLKPPTGQPRFNLLKMAYEGLMLPLSAALKKAKKENKVVRRENVRLKLNGQIRTMNFEVVPLKNLRERCFLIFFQEARKLGHAVPSAPRPRPSAKEESRRITELETELAETRDYLQSVEEEHEASNEEVQAANEEVTSANEELQSINEELETSKEELESANEELTTINDEMANRNAELSRLNSDLINLQTSTHLAIVLLGRDLTIRRFNSQAAKQFNLQAADVGRPLGGVRHNLVFPARNVQKIGDTPAFAKEDVKNERESGAQAAGESTRADEAVKVPDELETFIAEVIDTVREQEREVQDQDGRWHVLRVRPYMTLDNRVDGAVLVLVDIDVLKRTEQTIAAARDYAENILQTTREPLLVLDGDLRVERANRSFYRAFRVAPAGTVGQPIYDLGNRQWDIPRLRTLLEGVLPRHSTMENFEVEHDFEKLGRRTMILSARRIDDPTWKTQRILLAIDDITERKRLQQEIQNASVAEAVLRTAHDPLLILNADMRIHTANAAFYTAFKVSPADTEGCLLYDLGNRQWNTPKLRQLLGDILPRNSSFDSFELTHDFERIGRRTVLLNARKLDDASSWQARILLGIQDITDRKLAEESLREAKNLAEAASAAKDHFIATVSHELRTPLSAMLLRTRLLEEEDFGLNDERVRESLNVIQSCAEEQQKLVEDLVDTSRIIAGKLRLELKPTDLLATVRSAVKAVRPSAVEKNLAIDEQFDPETGWASADPHRLQQIVWILLSNAVKFTPTDGRIGIEMLRRGNDVELRISDTGQGIAPEFLPRMFERFRQAEQSTTRVPSGLGLGLAIAKQLVELHGGKISAHSPGLGKGAVFLVSLPLPVVDALAVVGRSNLPSDPKATLNGLRVMLLEDTTVMREALSIVLDEAGAEVAEFDGASEALEQFKTNRPDVIVSDIRMPLIDGHEFMRQVRAIEKTQELKPTPAVALTAYADEKNRDDALANGYQKFLTKPIDPKQLISALAEFKRRPEGGREVNP